jgi:protochlorophyllide reductase
MDKMEAVMEVDGFDTDNFTPMYCEMNSFDSVRKFCDQLDEFRLGKPIDRLLCNAGVYQPSLPYPKWSVDNHEQTMQINFLSHFLMISRLLPALRDAPNARVIMVGSVTGNDNTVGGGGVYPIADLHELEGFAQGFTNPISMIDGYDFIGAKAYKDSKLCLMMMANYLHTKYHKLTGISFSSMYPGCIAESPLFREKRAWFRQYFPVFMKFITGTCESFFIFAQRACSAHALISLTFVGGFVGEHEAGQRLFQTAHDPRCAKSGVYWGWNGGPREGRGKRALEQNGQISGGGGAGGGWDSIFENDQSAKVLDVDRATLLFHYATKITGAEWPELKAVTSPCPTLNVVGAVTKGMVRREELKRVKHSQAKEEKKKKSLRRKLVLGVDRVVTFALKNTVGRVAKLLGKRVLGEIPETAKQGSFHETQTPTEIKVETVDSVLEQLDRNQALLNEQIEEAQPSVVFNDAEDEKLFEQIYVKTSVENQNATSTSSLTPSA